MYDARADNLPAAAEKYANRQNPVVSAVLRRVGIVAGNASGRVLRPDRGGGEGNGGAGQELGVGGATSENSKLRVGTGSVAQTSKASVTKRATSCRSNVDRERDVSACSEGTARNVIART